MMGVLIMTTMLALSVQRVAIDIKDCIDKLSIDINDKELSLEFGE